MPEPVMKLLTTAGTVYIFHPERVHDITDAGKPGAPAAVMAYYVESEFDTNDFRYFSVEGISARDLKRSVQDNVTEGLGFLKLTASRTDLYGPQARRYINVDDIVYLSSVRIFKQIDGKEVQVGGAKIETKHESITVEGAPFAIAAQIRRVLKRLDQDEEFCCAADDAKVEDDTEAESE